MKYFKLSQALHLNDELQIKWDINLLIVFRKKPK